MNVAFRGSISSLDISDQSVKVTGRGQLVREGRRGRVMLSGNIIGNELYGNGYIVSKDGTRARGRFSRSALDGHGTGINETSIIDGVFINGVI